MGRWTDRARRVLSGEAVTRAEARSMLDADDLDELLDGALVLRSHHHGRGVKLHVLMNAKSGRCPEDCSFCSQSVFSKTPVEEYGLQSRAEMLAAARRAKESGAWRF